MGYNKRPNLIILGILLVLGLISVPLLNSAITTAAHNQKPTKAAIDPYFELIEELQSELQRTDLPIDARISVEEKLNTISMMATQRSEGLINPPTRQTTIITTPNNIEGYKLPDGIDNQPSFSFSQSIFTVNNEWRKTTEDHYYAVFAGFLTQDANQGAVYVLHNQQSNIPSFILFETPGRHGGLHIIAENGMIITLQSTDETIYYFNSATEQFVNDQGTPLPSTPTPFNSSTSTPIPYP